MNFKVNHVLILLVASTLAMVGLVIFQYKWINHSQKLADEIFQQRASMALCSTLEEYSDGPVCSPSSCLMACGPETGPDTTVALHADLLHNEHFHADLRKTLDFYNINLPYQLTQSPTDPAKAACESPMCVVTIPTQATQEESFFAMAFPDKEKFMLGKIKYMIAASFLILLFTAMVLWLANWWLMKQKRLLRTNTDMYNQMAHEFRTPLTNIQLAAGMLSSPPSAAGQQRFIDIIKKENARLIQQVERVLHMARLGNGDYALHPERIGLKGLLQQVCEEMQMQIEEKKAVVSVSGIPDGYEVHGDRQHLSNAFRNLIDNALKYADRVPEVHIGARLERDGILISVEDNGIGIPASQSKLIFEKFQRAQEGHPCDQKGFGLGLAYVKKIIELHKGFVQLDCSVTSGSRFNIFLPKTA